MLRGKNFLLCCNLKALKMYPLYILRIRCSCGTSETLQNVADHRASFELCSFFERNILSGAISVYGFLSQVSQNSGKLRTKGDELWTT